MAEEALRAKGKRLFAPIAADVSAVVSRGVGRPHLRLREDALRFRLEAHHAAGQQARVRVSLRDLHVLRLPAAIAVVLAVPKPPAARPPTSSPRSRARSTPSSSTWSAATTTRWRSGLAPTTTRPARRRCWRRHGCWSRHPQPATIVFASFTGEEAGLLGSREFVRRAVADKVQIVGALNNDMIGWANDHRLDNTIRYSNPGIRDIQHAAAMQFSNLITYDALYYKSTDAARLLRGVRRHRRRHRLLSGARESRTTTSRTTRSTPSTTS